MGAPGQVTLKYLAKELGLNVSTVSRVLNDPAGANSKWAAPATTERILALSKDLGYSRNPHAASLRTSRSDTVGVIVPRLQDFVLATIYEGIDEAATEHGLLALVANSLDDASAQRVKAERLLNRRADGLIFGDAHLQEPYLDELRTRGIPLVLVSRTSAGHVSVTCDDYAGGRLMAEHFLAAGRTSFGLIAGTPTTSTSRDRSAGFLDVLADAGHTVPEQWLIHGGFDAHSGQEAAARILAAGGAPEAIFAVNDFAAIGAIGVLREAGLNVPGDVAVGGFNDTPLAGGVNLTTVRSPMHEIGRQGLLALRAMMDGAAVDSVRLAPELVVRGSG